MKQKNKIIPILLIILSVFDVAIFVLAIFLSDLKYVFLGLGAGVFVLLVCASIIFYIKFKKSLISDTRKIAHGIKSYKNNQREIIELSSGNEELKALADEVSLLTLSGQDLATGFTYHDDNFISYLANHMPFEISQLAYINLDGDIRTLEFEKEYKNIYINKKSNCTELFIFNFKSRDELENKVVSLISSLDKEKLVLPKSKVKDEKYSGFAGILKPIECYIVYYPDYDFKQFNHINKLKVSKVINNIKIYDYEKNPYPISYFYQEVKLIHSRKDKDNVDIKELVTSAMHHLPYSHMVITSDGTSRYFKYESKEDYKDLTDIPYQKRHVLYNKNGHTLEVLLVSDSTLNFIDAQANKVTEILFNTLLEIYSYIFKETDKFKKEGFEDLIIKLGNYSYQIDKDYNLIDISENLANKFNSNQLSKKCYKALFNRDAPCENCPLFGDVTKHFVKIGSGEYTFTKVNDKDTRKIYILNEQNNVLSQNELYEKIIDSINNDKRGYVMIFKLDYLTDLSIKYKVSEEELVNKAIELLKTYSLDGNLYQKDKDEYAYVLEYLRYADCVELAKTLSTAFEDKVTVGENGVLLTPKIILLSYPLEINNLYSLISLSRSLFAKADKRGMLYRLSVDPVYVNKKREYLEIIEESLKNEDIPLIYYRIKDHQSEKNILRVDLDYRDNTNEIIREDAITLYAKLEKYYFSLLERTFKCVKYQENYEYIFYFSREAFDNALFKQVTKILNKMKISLHDIIIETDEIYLRTNKELIKTYSDMGYQFAMSSIEEDKPYNLPIKVKYVKVNKDKFVSSAGYGQKLLQIHNMGIPFLVDAKIEGIEERYIEVPGGEKF